MNFRFARPVALGVIGLASALAACNGNNQPDVLEDGFSFDLGCTTCRDVRTDRSSSETAGETGSETGGDDVVTPDANDVQGVDAPDIVESDAPDVVDDTSTTDASMTDATSDGIATDGRVDVAMVSGPCTGGAQVTLIDEPLMMLGRPIQLAVDSSSMVVAGSHMQMAGLDNAYFYDVPATDPLLAFWDVSGETGSRIEGGSFAPDGLGGYAMVYSSNSMGGFDVYARGITASGPPSGTMARVSNDADASIGAQIVRTGTGFLVVWRNEDNVAGTKSLWTATLSNPDLTVGTPSMLTPIGTLAGEFRLVSNTTGANLAYVSRTLGPGSDLSVQRFNADGTLNGTPVPIATGTTIMGPVAAAQRGNAIAVLWVEPRFEGALHGRTVDAASGVASPVVDLPEAGDLGALSVAADRPNGYVAAFRSQGATPGAAILRLDDSLHAREGVSRVADAQALGEVVTVASVSATSYAVAFTDPSTTGGTHGVVQWVTCP